MCGWLFRRSSAAVLRRKLAMSIRLGRVQLRIMQVLWERGRVTAREITDVLSAESPIAHSTVQTLLRNLEAKGAAGHDSEGRTFVFFPLVREEQVTKSVTRDLLDRVFEATSCRIC
jgi:BlaI family penicillinase repressor